MATKRKQTRSGGGAARGRRKNAGGAARGRSAAGRSAGGARTMDAFKLLKSDHREVERLVEEFEKARSPKKAQLAEEIVRNLRVHAMIEEEIFYPAAREALRDEDLIEEAEVEHQSAKDLMAQIEGGDSGDGKFEARVKVLGEYVKHHVREEEKEMFAQLQKARKFDAQAIGERMMQRKQELLGMAEAGEQVMDEEAAPSRGSRANGARAPREDAATMNADAAGTRSR